MTVMDTLKFPLTHAEAELVAQALDVYATTLMCAPLGLGLDLLVDVRGLRERLEFTADQHDAVREASGSADGNVLVFARG